jgi:hypothetical protein
MQITEVMFTLLVSALLVFTLLVSALLVFTLLVFTVFICCAYYSCH